MPERKRFFLLMSSLISGTGKKAKVSYEAGLKSMKIFLLNKRPMEQIVVFSCFSVSV